jgi:hypothetical protein
MGGLAGTSKKSEKISSVWVDGWGDQSPFKVAGCPAGFRELPLARDTNIFVLSFLLGKKFICSPA